LPLDKVGNRDVLGFVLEARLIESEHHPYTCSIKNAIGRGAADYCWVNNVLFVCLLVWVAFRN
jgi:hypothetical protein